ncbi:MAG: WecB/TagA/CpsF family glycosyltransferase [Cyanobacteria bacterium P01_D01_bin.73]
MTVSPLQSALVLGLPVHLSRDYVGWLCDRIETRQGTIVVTINAEMAVRGEQDGRLGKTLRNADLVVPDGAGVVLHLRAKGYSVERCPGIELAESLLAELARRPGWKAWFYGGSPGVSAKAAEVLTQRYPGLQFAGVNHGFLDEAAVEEQQQQLASVRPEVILVGLGVPRQEYWIEQHRHLCPNALWIGVGGSFDIWSGTKERAPEWFCKNNLEWLYRLYQEPWRWRRMLALPHFVWRSLLERLRPAQPPA